MNSIQQRLSQLKIIINSCYGMGKTNIDALYDEVGSLKAKLQRINDRKDKIKSLYEI